jgi:hypothetical protein
VWTVRLPDDAVTVDPSGKLLTVDARDVAVIDERPEGDVPAVVSFRISWKGRGRLQRRGSDAPAFAGDFFRRAVARGTFAASEAGFAFASNPGKPVRSLFAILGTETNGRFLAAAQACPGCSTGRPAPLGSRHP